MNTILAGKAGFNPFSSVAVLGLKGLVILGLLLLLGAVVYIIYSWFTKRTR